MNRERIPREIDPKWKGKAPRKDRLSCRALHADGGPFQRPGDADCYSQEEVEFMMAMERYKRDNRRINPTFAEVLAVVRALGYRKVEP